MTISKEYLLEQLERAVESRLDALKTFHLRDGAVQMLELLLQKLDEPEPVEAQLQVAPPVGGRRRRPR